MKQFWHKTFRALHGTRDLNLASFDFTCDLLGIAHAKHRVWAVLVVVLSILFWQAT